MVAVPLTATFTTAGAFTWTAPPGVTSVTVACQGAGGGGGSATVSGSNGGGGGGEAAVEPAVAVTPGLSYAGTAGAAGTGGNAGTAGTAGGDTSFTGDVTTVTAHGGGGGGVSGAVGAGAGALGGTASTNTVSADGGAGDDGTPATSGGGGGGGGGASVTAGFPGNAAVADVAGAASGGTWPGAAGGAGNTSGTGAGHDGTTPGGGGGGAVSTGTNRDGGAGGGGQVTITWTMTDPVTLTAATTGSVTTFQAPPGTTSVKAEAWGGGAGGFNQATAGSASVAGSSAFTNVYGSPRSVAADTFDGYVNRRMAHAAQVVYFTEGQWPTTTDSQAFSELVALGAKVLVCFKPLRSAVVAGGGALAAEIANLSAACDLYNSVAGANWYAAIANEPNNSGAKGPFGDGSQEKVGSWVAGSPYGTNVSAAQAATNYHAYHAAFAPTINGKGLKVAYKPLMSTTTAAFTFFPGAGSATGGCDLLMVDWYCMDYEPLGSSSTDIFGASNIEGVADTSGLPLGIGEWGVAGGSASATLAQWTDFTNHMAAGFAARIAAGKPVADVIYFAGLSAGGQSTVTGPGDFKVPGIQVVADAVNQAAAVGGAGGGGGEYAAETTLVITGGTSYALVVGAGGGGRTSGADSTVAGDSVTVRAHGGSVATTQSAGGSGGQGGVNSTHHKGGDGGPGGVASGGGGGGGASGGTALAGGTGGAGTASAGGAAGAAVTGGGPGGTGGKTTGAGNGAPPLSGPGGGGGARAAAGQLNGSGADGQIILSSFVVNVACSGGLTLAPLGLAATAGVPAGSLALAPLALAGTANACAFTQVQLGTIASGTGTGALTLPGNSAAGSLLYAVMNTSGATALTGPAGWQLAAAEPGGAGGRTEIWYYPSNPGGITTASFTGGGGDTVRGFLVEASTPAGTSQVLDTTGVANGGAGVTSFPVSTSGANTGADLGVVAFTDRFSVSTAGSWTTPANWALLRSQTSLANWITGYARCGLAATTQAVTGTASTSTNQTGWGAVLVTFKAVTSNTCTGGLTLAPLALSATGSSIVPPGTVATSGGLTLAPLAFQSPSQAVTFPGSKLPVKVEILVNGAWADITGYVYARDGITISNRGRPDEASVTQPTQVTLTLNNIDQSFSPQNAASQFYPYLLRNTQIRISVVNAVTSKGAWYTGYRFWGEVPSWPPLWNTAGTDVYVPITACGVLQRMRQSKFSASPLARYYANLITAALAAGQHAALTPAGYWPCEDGTSSATFTSGIPGGSPMIWTGTPGLASDSNVPGSAPFAQLNSSAWTGVPGAFGTGGISFTTPGTFAWTCPAGITTIKAECWGGGGGGSNGIWGTGGAGGEYAAEPALAVTPGSVYTVVVGTGGQGGGGSFGGASGTAGTSSTFSGNTVTVRAHAGGGGPSSSSGHASGGSGSTNTTHHSGGNGAANDAGNGGSGGGSSGGPGAAGNTGGTSGGDAGGNGATAIPGGGPGGQGGPGKLQSEGAGAGPGLIPFPGPGGGGGGGGFSGFNNYGKPGGGGQAGQVTISFGSTPAPFANVLRAVVDVPSTGGVDSSYLVQSLTSGTIADLHIKYHTGGNLELRGNNAGGSQLFSTGSKSFGANGQPLLVSAELTQKTPTSITWKLTAIKPAATVVVATYTGTVTGTLGSVTSVKTNSTAPIETGATGVGHISVQYAVDPILNLAPAFAAYAGETAGARFLRLCGEQRVPVTLTGTAAGTPQMGPQPTGLLVDLLQDCENADLGLMFERRDAFGLGYRTRASLQNQAPAVTLDHSGGQLAQGLTPTNDDQMTHNDIIATRAGGGTSYEAIQSTGPLSVQDPPNGVGLYTYSVTPNLFADSQLAAFAQWLLILGTLDEFRYPLITVDLRRAQVSDGTFSTMANLDVGDFLAIINPPPWLPPAPVNQLAVGFTETLNMFAWVIAVNAVPEDPYSNGSADPPLPTW